MGTIRRKIFADIFHRKGWTVLVALSILVGVFGVSLMIGVGDLIRSQLEKDLQPDRRPMITLVVDLPAGQTTLQDNQAYLEAIAALPGVTTVQGSVYNEVPWRKAGSAGDFWGGLVLTYTQPLDQLSLEPLAQAIDGHYPRPRAGEIAVERRFAEANDVKVGDKLVFQSPSAPADPVEWTVAGIIYAPYAALHDDPADLIFAHYDDAQQIAGFRSLSVIAARYDTFSAAGGGEEDLIRFVSAQTPYVVAETFLDDPEHSLKMQEVDDVVGVLNMLGIISMVVAGFLVSNVINTIIVEQRQQIGILKAIGATRWETFLIYAGMALVYGMIGTFFGILLSIPATAIMARALTELAETYIDGFRLSARGLGIGAVMGLLVPVVVAAIPVLNGTRATIREAITDLGISSKWGTGPLARLIGRLPVPMTVRQGLSNIVQKRGRLILTVLALTFAAGSFMGVQASFNSISGLVDTVFAQFNYDVQIYPETPHSLEEIRQALAAQNVEYASLSQGFAVNVGLEGYQTPESATESNQIPSIGIDPDNSAYRLDLREGEGWQTGVTCTGENINTAECQSVILSRTLANLLGKHPGDTVIVTGGGESIELTVVGVDNIPFDTLYFRWDALAMLAGYVDANGVPFPNVFFVKMNTADPSIDEANNKIKEIAGALQASGIQAGFDNRPENEDEEIQGINIFGFVFNITSAVFAAVGGIGLLAVLSMSVLERQKEIGVIRSIGGSSRAIIAQFLTEGILVGLVAWLLGLPLSYLLATVLIDAMPFSTTIDFHYPLSAPLIGLVGVILFATVASLWPSISASRRTVSDILRYS